MIMNTALLLIVFSSIACSCSGTASLSSSDINLPVRAVNLGGWLVVEGWIKPSLFDGIPNKDLLDGTGLQLKSVKFGKYLSAENGGGSIVVANRSSADSEWEIFTLWRINETTFNFRVFNKQFVGVDIAGNGIDIVAVADTPAPTQTFQIERNPDDSNRVRIKAPNGSFLQVKREGLVSADYDGNGGWGNDDPSVFQMAINVTLDGEYQLTNGYGPLLAPPVMKEHWSTFIVEDDFKFMKENGLDTVRIPVGWWIARDPPPKPYVGGSLQALDNAFSWAEKYGIKVIFDLHAAPGSQNGAPHSSTRDGSQEWGLTDANIQLTVDVIDFLTARYANSSSLFAVELLNEPLPPGVTLEILTKYYRAGLEVVRRYSTTVYVVLASRLGYPSDPTELFSLANEYSNTAIDMHYYNLFSDRFDNYTVQQNIDYIYNRTEQIEEIMANGPLLFIGEWVAEWNVVNASKEDYQRYAEAQLQVFGLANFGWAYWTLKSVENYWSLEWMINNGYINLNSSTVLDLGLEQIATDSILRQIN